MFSLYKNILIYFADSLQNGLIPCKKVRTPFGALCPTVFNHLKYTKKILKESFLIPLTNAFWLKNHIGAIISYYFKIEIFSVYK